MDSGRAGVRVEIIKMHRMPTCSSQLIKCIKTTITAYHGGSGAPSNASEDCCDGVSIFNQSLLPISLSRVACSIQGLCSCIQHLRLCFRIRQQTSSHSFFVLSFWKQKQHRSQCVMEQEHISGQVGEQLRVEYPLWLIFSMSLSGPKDAPTSQTPKGSLNVQKWAQPGL